MGARTAVAALRDVGANWRSVAATDLIYKAISFAVLMPAVGILFRLLLARGGGGAVADVDIAYFLFTTWPGVVALIFLSAFVVAVVALEQACLMTLGLANVQGTHLRVRDAFAQSFARAFTIYRLTGLFVIRVLGFSAPFIAALGATYWALLTKHDINYYLGIRPPEFWGAVAIGVVILIAYAMVVGRRICDWILALPIVVFEGVLPVQSFGESTRRMTGRRRAAAIALVAWGVTVILLSWLAKHGLALAGRLVAPAFGSTMAGLLLFIGSFAVVWVLVFLAIGVLAAALIAQIVVLLYVDAGLTDAVKLPPPFHGELELGGRRLRISWPAIAGGLVALVVATAFLANVMLKATWTEHPVLVFGHRGAPDDAPENTMASFRRAVEQQADYIELDVQESADGIVLVNHDVDLMKDGNSPLKIWQSRAAELQAVDIGSSFAPKFASERVPSLAEVLAYCKDTCRINIELKDYGHNVQLEERVVALVEAAGMQDRIVTQSLSPKMVLKMKELRPTWTSGLLAAKAIGSPRDLPGDFAAVEQATAARKFIRLAHAAGKQVYVWTVNDPPAMIRFIGFGADGLITDKPALGKEVVATYMGMTEVERLYLFVMTRLGAAPAKAVPESELRP